MTFLLVLLFNLLTKNKDKAGIITTFILFVFFSYGLIFNSLINKKIGQIALDNHQLLLAIWSILFIVVYFLILRTRKNLTSLSSFFTIVSLALIAITTFSILFAKFENKSRYLEQNQEKITLTAEQEDNLPDIYYIILDSYTSNNNLQKIYGYNNNEFTDNLKSKGFIVPSNSQSNYANTFLSLSSSLNMKYINGLSEDLGENSQNRSITYDMISNNKIYSLLKSINYKSILVSPSWGPANASSKADFSFRYDSGGEFRSILFKTTMLRVTGNQKNDRERTLYEFTKLSEIPSAIKDPKFVFVHIICPHAPYVFDANGEPVNKDKLLIPGGDWKQKDDYVNQLIYINKEVNKTVDDILASSKNPPIIIIQADHGTASTFSDDQWNNPSEESYGERMGIFNAYYLPNGGDNIIYDNITPVNSFRLIFNYYFKTNYEKLDDRSYFSTYGQPYKFLDVTEKVKF